MCDVIGPGCTHASPHASPVQQICFSPILLTDLTVVEAGSLDVNGSVQVGI